MGSMPRAPHEVLGIRPDATLEEAHAAWRRVVLATHPDLNPGDEMAALRCAEANAAWTTLSGGWPDRPVFEDEPPPAPASTAVWRHVPVPPPPRRRRRPDPEYDERQAYLEESMGWLGWWKRDGLLHARVYRSRG
jgi:hypothetical protein